MARYYLKWKYGDNRFLEQFQTGFADMPVGAIVSEQPTYFGTKREAEAAKKGWCKGTWILCKE